MIRLPNQYPATHFPETGPQAADQLVPLISASWLGARLPPISSWARCRGRSGHCFDFTSSGVSSAVSGRELDSPAVAVVDCPLEHLGGGGTSLLP